jgi:dTDP-4-amino-4,6-dideoxygalactose transaminase
VPRLFLSPPHLGPDEAVLVAEAFASNWISSVGPQLDAFEREVAALLGVTHAVALSSGTAALHLALRHLDVGPGDEVWCSSLTFAASANPIVYERATPVFIDSEERSWNLDPALLADALDDAARRGRLPRAVVVVDLYGQCADHDPILAACARHGVPVIGDAAEALGAQYKGRPAGGLGWCGVISFNGNKIITTSGGGMLVSHDAALIAHARKLATQAREPAAHYQHHEIGFNYRLSNVLAAIGRGQLRVLGQRVEARRRINAGYAERLTGVPGITLMPEERFGSAETRANRWLTVLQVDEAKFGCGPESIRLALEREDIESRPVWKPLHMQPVFAGCRMIGGAVSERLFAHGLCLPSGSAMGEAEIERVARVLRALVQTS